MDLWLILFFALAGGFITAGVARRYGYDTTTWFVFGAVLFVVALPYLFFKGPRSARPYQALAGDKERIQSSPVVRMLVDGDASFEELERGTGLDEDDLADELDWLMDRELVEPDGQQWTLTPRGFLLS